MRRYLLLFLIACGGGAERIAPDQTQTSTKAFTSDIATLLDFEFDAKFVTPSKVFNTRQAVEDHLLYTIGHLNWNEGVGRLDAISLSNVRSKQQADGTFLTEYHVILPVAWSGTAPTTYAFTLPKRGDWPGYEAFATKYSTTCIDAGAHEVTAGNMWYYYRPRNCTPDAEDVFISEAKVSTNAQNTSGKYPEYHEIWKDDALDVIAIFGKYEDGATTASDAGVSAFNELVRRAKQELGKGVQTVPANVSDAPGVQTPDVTFTMTRADGKQLRLTALLVDNVRTAGAAFDARYNALSKDADLIIYNGHAGLGSNVRALVRKGEFVASKYQIFFMNGCDTFAYVDGALAATKKKLNPEDANGTKYLDMITNAMPSYFHANADNDIAIMKALLDTKNPSTYDQIFRNVDSQQVVVATGEEDNVYFPGYENGDEPATWPGLTAKASVTQGAEWRVATQVLPAGDYTFAISGDAGDADLYVRVGQAPSSTVWDCRPYATGSNETCTVTLTAPAAVHAMVFGYAPGTNAFTLNAR